MAVLEELPDEILIQILACLYRREQLANFSLTCRRHRSLVAPFLHDCKSYRHFNSFLIGSPCGLPGIPFHSILKSPELCQHVLRASVRVFPNNFPTSKTGDHLDGRKYKLVSSEEAEILERAVEYLRIREWENGNELVEALNDRNMNSLVTLFLLLLSNLEKLSMAVQDNPWIGWAIRKVTSSHPPPLPASPSWRCGFHALRKVMLVRVNPIGTAALDNLAPFFLLPSIERIWLDRVLHVGDFKWDGGAYGMSTVTALSISSSAVSVRALEELLRIPKALSYFQYECGGVYTEDDPEGLDELSDEEWCEGYNVYREFDYDRVLDVVRQAQPGLDETDIDIEYLENYGVE